MYRTAFPDLHFTIGDQTAEGEKVVTRWTAIGTHQGELMGIPPTRVQGSGVMGICIDHLARGKTIEIRTNWDTLGKIQQLGVIPPTGGSAR